MVVSKKRRKKPVMSPAQRMAQQAKVIQQLLALQTTVSTTLRNAKTLGIFVRVESKGTGVPVLFTMSAISMPRDRRPCGCRSDEDCDCDDDLV
jgi:hypothetical protein